MLGGTNLLIILGLAIMFPLIMLGALKNPSLGLGALLFSIPFLSLAQRLFPETAQPFPSLETIAVILLWISVQLRRLVHKPPVSRENSIGIAWGIFLAAGLASTLVAQDQGISIRIFIAGGVAPWLCYSVASRYVRSPADVKIVVYSFFGLIFQVAIFTALAYDRRQGIVPMGQDLVEFLYNQANAVNVLGSPSVTMATLSAALPLAAWYRAYGKWQNNTVWTAILVAVFSVAILSLSRGSWLGVLFGILGSLPLYFKQVRVKTLIIIAVVMILFYYFFGGVISEALNYRYTSNISRFTIEIRKANYLLAIRSSQKHVFLGVGLGNYPDIYQEFPFDTASFMTPLWFAHSLILTLIPEIGLIGMFAFLYIIVSIVIRGFRQYKVLTASEDYQWLVYSLCIGVVSYLVVASISGSHLVATKVEYLTAPALIVTLSFLGIISSAIVEYGVTFKGYNSLSANPKPGLHSTGL